MNNSYPSDKNQDSPFSCKTSPSLQKVNKGSLYSELYFNKIIAYINTNLQKFCYAFFLIRLIRLISSLAFLKYPFALFTNASVVRAFWSTLKSQSKFIIQASSSHKRKIICVRTHACISHTWMWREEAASWGALNLGIFFTTYWGLR